MTCGHNLGLTTHYRGKYQKIKNNNVILAPYHLPQIILKQKLNHYPLAIGGQTLDITDAVENKLDISTSLIFPLQHKIKISHKNLWNLCC